ncbi:hypothetical protein [Asticcacaulis sp. YBE204]|uniref:hypothetical protein n=1 Tax=Asticcacaulis sp. YBE204 TaxID=1282363 RepID=UPI0003C406A0|nr:hypothetical protein [Asticcacaulis sp. YBE204]ESQ78779.1 hypothetical protein AEYBE204_12410 [Asticcacaulis sp. YBE204]
MSQVDRTKEQFTPEERRARLRAFADRMLACAEKLPDPEILPDIERAVRIGDRIERLYARADASEAAAAKARLEVYQHTEALQRAEADTVRRAEHTTLCKRREAMRDDEMLRNEPKLARILIEQRTGRPLEDYLAARQAEATGCDSLLPGLAGRQNGEKVADRPDEGQAAQGKMPLSLAGPRPSLSP